MKKHYLAIAMMSLALGMTACSSKPAETSAPAETSTSAAQTEENQEAAAPADTDEAEEDYFYGLVSEAAEGTLTVTDEDGTAAKFDISEATVEGAAETAGVGDEVEITFEGALSEDVTKAKVVDIITSAAAEAEQQSEEEAAAENDLTITGTIEAADDETITLKTEDGSYVLNSIIAQKVTKDGIKAGAEADVTYYGDLEDPDDRAVATKIVTADARDTEDAKINTLTGTAAEVGSDYVVLDTADPDNTLFSFIGTAGMFDGVNVGDTVTVIYQGTLTDKTITAVRMK